MRGDREDWPIECHWEQRRIKPFTAQDRGPGRLSVTPLSVLEDVGPEGRAAFAEILAINYRSEMEKAGIRVELK